MEEFQHFFRMPSDFKKIPVRTDLTFGNFTMHRRSPCTGGLKQTGRARTNPEVIFMKFMRSLRWLALALIVIATAAQQQASAQLPVGTTRVGSFTWDGEKWIPTDLYQSPAPPPPAIVVEDEIVADTPPPPMPDYDQPPCPEPNLMWTPGNWHWGPGGYFWVPGAWVPAPYTGALWTPPYWGFAGGHYGFHAGYWGPHIGFYGGVNYGGGYMGIGFAGGTWNGGVFAYNTAVVHVNVNVVTNVYVNRTIVEQTTIVNTNHVAFNGGPNGIQHAATPEEQTATHETHTPPTSFQAQHINAAKADTSNFAKNNGGHPTKLADTKPLAEEKRPAPAGFKPPPARPAAELAKAQAPASTVEAAKAATTKTAAVKPPAPAAPKAAPPAPARTAAPAVTNAPKPMEKPVAPAPGKPAVEPTPKPAERPAAPMTTKPLTPTTTPKPAERAPAPSASPKAPEKAPPPAVKPAEKPAPPAKTPPPAKADKNKKPEKKPE
jgi:hypothetical protein